MPYFGTHKEKYLIPDFTLFTWGTDMALQWNLYIADMLYSGHFSIEDTFSRNQLYPAMVKPLYFEPLYSGHISIADTFSENQWCPLLRGFTVGG